MEANVKRQTQTQETRAVQVLGAASELTLAIGNTGVEPNGQPLFYK